MGGWIINHKYDAEKIRKTVEIEGYYDINVWYSYADNTKTEVVTERVKYVDVIKLRYRDNNYLDDEHEVIAKSFSDPNCLEVTISPNGNKIVVQAEREFLAEVVGETKVVVEVNPDWEEEDEEDWEDELDEELEDINPEFLVEILKNKKGLGRQYPKSLFILIYHSLSLFVYVIMKAGK